ncbi:hypothetical protein SAMN05216524_102199 [Mucilaginibacter sp. OK098]|nr:hypothetical protein SAMN05216524_102199 [Mucilaginibacter sp. OK098]
MCGIFYFMGKRKFLEADWNNLLMLNYEVDPRCEDWRKDSD